MKSRRLERIADRIRDTLARLLLEEVRDPRIGFVTLTGVEVSADLGHAKVFVTALGGDRQEETLRALNGAAPFLQRELGRALRLRAIPHLRFLHDPSLDRGERVESLLREAGVPETEDAGDDGEPR